MKWNAYWSLVETENKQTSTKKSCTFFIVEKIIIGLK